MENMKRGIVTYLIVLVAVVAAFVLLPGLLRSDSEVNTSTYQRYLKNGDIVEAQINQNSEVPTGNVQFRLSDGTIGRVYVSDVKEAEEELKHMEEFRKAQEEIEKKNEKPMSQKMFKVI